MLNQFSRTIALLGEENFNKLKNSHIAIFGIGGVGGYAVESLARSGVEKLDLFDNDTISITNINRQIIATLSTVGEYKTVAMKNRISDINKDCVVTCHNVFYTCDNSKDFDLSIYDYVIDAIDTVSSKIELIINCKKLSIPIISSMGAGNKLDPTGFIVSDISKTSVCPLARVMRYELKKRNISNLKVIYSKEKPLSPINTQELPKGKRQIPASISFIPSVVGEIAAGEVIKDLCNLHT